MLLSYIRVTIQILSPWRVGAPGEDRSRQATLTDLAGNPVIPASSLAGSFRSHLGGDAERLMGRTGAEDPEASSVWFLGTRLTGSGDSSPRVETRTGTSISRTRKAARLHGSHGIDEVHDTDQVNLYLRCDDNLEEVLDHLAAWRPTIGGGITTGLGKAKVSAIRYRTIDTSRPEDIVARATMGGSGPEGLDRLLTRGKDYELRVLDDRIVLSASLDIEDYHLLGREATPEKDPGRLEHRWYQGSRWKGLLRSRVEYIGRSIGLQVCGADEGAWHGCGCCAVCEVFGSGTTGAGRWVFGITRLSDPPPLGGGRTRNAIDRFTGGVLDKRLFYEDTSTTRNATLVITEREPLEPHHAWVAKALLLTLKDLNDGYVGIGGRSATGLGRVHLNEWTLGPSIEGVLGAAPAKDEPPLITADDVEAARTAQQEKETAHVG